MGTLQDSIDRAIEARSRDAVLDTIRANPEATLAEVLDLFKGRYGNVAKTITIGELTGPAADRAARPTPAPPGDINTRTPTGRRRYDEAVVGALRGAPGPLSASQIRDRVGGTPLQTRTALNRLIDAGKVKWTGKARGTRYRLA